MERALLKIQDVRVEWTYGVRLVSNKVRQSIAGGRVNEAIPYPLSRPHALNGYLAIVTWERIDGVPFIDLSHDLESLCDAFISWVFPTLYLLRVCFSVEANNETRVFRDDSNKGRGTRPDDLPIG